MPMFSAQRFFYMLESIIYFDAINFIQVQGYT